MVQSVNLKVKNATVLTQDAQRRVLRNCDILVEGNRIAKIGKNLSERAEVELDCRNKLVMPGMINAHTHLAMVLLRSYADDMELKEWLEKAIWPIEAKLKKEDVYTGSLLGALEMIRSGTTCFADMYFFPEETKRACEKIGLRANLALTFFDFPMHGITAEDIFQMKPEKSELVDFSIGPHAIYTVGKENYIKAKEFAEKNGVKIQTHLAETRDEIFEAERKFGSRPVEYLDEIGVLSERLLAAHCVWLTKKEIGLLAKRNVNIVHCPVSNMKLSSGSAAPIPEMLGAGLNIALGTDGATSNNSLNMFETMKMCALLQKHSRWNPKVCTAQEVIDFATINGAKALGINAGSIEEEKLADFITLDLRAPNLSPVHGNLASLVVYAANPSNVCDVVVNGKILMEKGKIACIDEEKVVEEAQKQALELVSR